MSLCSNYMFMTWFHIRAAKTVIAAPDYVSTFVSVTFKETTLQFPAIAVARVWFLWLKHNIVATLNWKLIIMDQMEAATWRDVKFQHICGERWKVLGAGLLLSEGSLDNKDISIISVVVEQWIVLPAPPEKTQLMSSWYELSFVLMGCSDKLHSP